MVRQLIFSFGMFFFAALLYAAPTPAHAQLSQPSQPTVTVIELYSSLSCGYCPGAEANFKQLAASNPNVIPMTCFVMHPALKDDPVGRPFCGQRQSAYAKTAENGRRGTPTFLINGSEMLGNMNERFQQWMQPSITGSQTIPITITTNPGAANIYRLSMPSVTAPERGGYDLWVAVIRPTVPGRKILSANSTEPASRDYEFAIDQLARLDGWNGRARTYMFRAQPNQNAARYVFFAENSLKQIVAAGQVVAR